MWAPQSGQQGLPSFCSLSGVCRGVCPLPTCHTESKMKKKCPLSIVPLYASELLQAFSRKCISPKVGEGTFNLLILHSQICGDVGLLKNHALTAEREGH